MARGIYAEVVGFKDERLILMPMDEVGNLEPGSTVVTTGARCACPWASCLGRIFDGLGRPSTTAARSLAPRSVRSTPLRRIADSRAREISPW